MWLTVTKTTVRSWVVVVVSLFGGGGVCVCVGGGGGPYAKPTLKTIGRAKQTLQTAP